MGLIERVKVKEKNPEFTKHELEFLLVKMRSATYKGDEFETFYNVWVKIVEQIDKLKD